MPIARALAHLEPLKALGYIWYVMYFSKGASNGASLLSRSESRAFSDPICQTEIVSVPALCLFLT